MTATDQFNFERELSEDIRTRFYINGQWAQPNSPQELELVSPISEEVIFRLPAASVEDVDAAIESARRAFDSGLWSATSRSDRAAALRRIAAEMRDRLPLFSRVWTAQVGAPSWFAERFTSLAAAYFDYYADLISESTFESERAISTGRVKVIREPVGVCALIVPWNAPLVLLAQKLAAALAAGCTVVTKPSPETPLDAQVLAECVRQAGLPDGVFNVVPAGREVGDWLIRQPMIDKVSFTGSTAAGKHIAQVCSDRLARVSLELGGKSAAVICDDADIDAWIANIAPFTMPFSGQICFSQTRVLVPRKRHDEFVDAYTTAIQRMKVGNPWEPDTVIGPVATANQYRRVMDFIGIAKREGANVVLGGTRASGHERGYFVAPTVFDNVRNDMTIAREEVFGPVVSIIDHNGDDDAVRIANDSNYGLSGTVFSNDVERAERIARRIRTGNLTINGLQLDPSVPFGGFKQSGLGREGGPEGLAMFTETKAIYLPANPSK
ncbi:aldehyde dehydrogenase [Paraburkholderia sp. BL25I1N1]|uniref:aldehyde dehydrogenase n=1 Tax=Paraburkholderia sp. BL25I1N1 TaxID=1938804 RepID=UPI000D048B05|nr:aldehyde dehydrogenase [Paraburkholderia sp. BL25I1N1]PRX96394.1 acyl-CoA reductase-like NAD-dependent aldehyde dehydrogenase [Paraburkholderia sp. BL25I1N1]